MLDWRYIYKILFYAGRQLSGGGSHRWPSCRLFTYLQGGLYGETLQLEWLRTNYSFYRGSYLVLFDDTLDD